MKDSINRGQSIGPWLRRKDLAAILFMLVPCMALILFPTTYLFAKAQQRVECGLHNLTLLDFVPGDIIKHKILACSGIVLENQDGPQMKIRWVTDTDNGIQNAYEVEWKQD